MINQSINQTFCTAINHLLEAEDWAREKTRAHAGKTASIQTAGLDLRFSIEASGLLAPLPTDADAATEPALVIALPPRSLLDALRGDEAALKNVDVRGDAELAQTVLFLVGHLRWDVEEDLSRLIGDIAAHRLVSDFKNLLAWERDARSRLAQSAGDYLTAEAGILAAAAPIEGFAADVDRLRDDTARLEKRLARIEPGQAGSKS